MELISSQEKFEKALANDLITYKCPQCKNNFERLKVYGTKSIKEKRGLHCSRKCFAKTKLFTPEQIKTKLDKYGLIYAGGEYTGVDDFVSYYCKCGEITKIKLHSLRHTKNFDCEKCRNTKLTLERRAHYKEQVDKYAPLNIKVLVTEEEFINFVRKPDYVETICEKGHIRRKGIWQKARPCIKCANYRRGKLAYNYVDGYYINKKTPRSPFQPELIKWKQEVLKIYGHNCMICGGKKKLNAHHLNSFHWDIENRFNPKNGIIMCSCCHDKFHKEYGQKNNTFSQFQKFYNRDSIKFSIYWNRLQDSISNLTTSPKSFLE